VLQQAESSVGFHLAIAKLLAKFDSILLLDLFHHFRTK
jgi:hypothetical protein